MKIAEIIERIEKWHAPLEHPDHTLDSVKTGDAAQECTGIAVTVCVTVEVIQKAAEEGCNLIIGHEPVFYGDSEYAPSLEDDPVYLKKKELLEACHMVVYRDHDHMHGPGGIMAKVHTETDHIYYGIMKELGWEEYRRGEETKPLWYEIPETTVRDLAGELMEAFGLDGVRIVGDQAAAVKTVFFCEHVFGRPNDYETIAKAAKADVMIPLEIVDWTLTEYVRDAVQLGLGKAVIEMGHFNTEELGMKYLAKQLSELPGLEAPVRFIKSGDSYSYILR